ncbi:MAG TPA: rhodanese-like domain-containing protein [Bryobacteraceae bacterium]|nr:rhodanese-like domain-containing protein [Bryobacteraceae bacterium]
MSQSLEITPQEAKSRLASPGKATLVDVREPNEFAVAHIPGSRLLPMQSIPAELQHLEKLADGADLLILCHHGVRSLQVANWLRAQGIDNSYSIAGGIDRWSHEVDPEIPQY